ncbi:MAG: AHH domain-containing protein [Polyangiales bacterium]
MEIGEAIAFGMTAPEAHDERVCPWHGRRSPPGGALKPANPEERIPPNDAGLLDAALAEAGHAKPEGVQVTLRFAPGPRVKDGKKTIATFAPSEEAVTYEVVFSAHHLIPGNESLKGNAVLRWVGDDASLGGYRKQVQSMLAPQEFTGYDINAAANGAWLPGPYALSTEGNWPRKGRASKSSADFKRAYAHAVMDQCGRQFHFRHTKYSEFVSEQLTKIAVRADTDAGRCPVANEARRDEKYLAPGGLVARLDAVSARLRPFVIGKRWNAAIYTDNDAGEDYVRDRAARRGRR